MNYIPMFTYLKSKIQSSLIFEKSETEGYPIQTMKNFKKYCFKQIAFPIFVVIVIVSYIVLYAGSDILLASVMSAASALLFDFGERENVITILFWTKYYDHDPLNSSLLTAVTKGRPECFKQCRIVTDHNYLRRSDAVLFHSRDLESARMPTVRSNQQVWIYLDRESPANKTTNLGEFANVFNWTMTYRRDSDVPFPFGKISKRNQTLISSDASETLQKQLQRHLKEKVHSIFWIVSNCETVGKRENFVAELKKYIPVHIYGGCGKYPCHRKNGGCFPELASFYKFFLSFENSLCWDYATAKLYDALYFTLVPIVYGGGDYEVLAPPHSVINVKDFNSTAELANYLKFLDTNATEYLKYFEWKREYQVTENYWKHPEPWCNLCEKLVEQKRNPKMKRYGDLWTWWNYDMNKSDSGTTVPVQACSRPSISLPKISPFPNASERRSRFIHKF